MRPEKLWMQAFGPFAERQFIDFSDLGNSPLFLINGATGAGKSTILDAICYALYGHTSGAEREAAQMRCDHAPQRLLTEVILEFGLGKRHYRIRRVPQQERPKARGEGLTQQQPEAQLWLLDGSEQGELLVPRSVNQANQRIRQLIGLDLAQFRQVMILPQGKFRELLLADSREREQIFSQLFQTRIYQRIEEQLKQRAAGIRQAVDQHRNQIKGILHSVDMHSTEELEAALKQLQPELDKAAQIRQTTQAQLERAGQEQKQAQALQLRLDDLQQKQRQLQDMQKQETTVQQWEKSLQLSRLAQQLQPLYQTWHQQQASLRELLEQQRIATERLEALREQEQNAQNALHQATQAHGKVSELRRQGVQLQQYLQLQQQMHQAESIRDAAADALHSAETALASAQAGIQQLVAEREALEQQIASAHQQLQATADLRLREAQARQQWQDRERLHDCREQISVLKQKRDYARQQQQQSRQAHEQARVQLRTLELQWRQGQAALLASQLQAAKPCPVCGSLEHPAPAHQQAATVPVTEEMLDQARQYEQRQQQSLNEQQQRCSALEKDLSLLCKTAAELEQQLGAFAHRSSQQMQQRFDELRQQVAALHRLQGRLAQWQQRQQQLGQSLEEQQQHTMRLQQQQQEAREELVAISSRVQQAAEQIPDQYRQGSQLQETSKALEKQIRFLEQSLSDAQDAHARQRSLLDKAQARLEALQEQRQEQEQQLGQVVQQWQSALAASPFADASEFSAALLDDARQQEMEQQIINYRQQRNTLQGVVEHLLTETQGQSSPDLAAIEHQLRQSAQAHSEADEQWRQLQARHEQLQRIRQKLQRADEKSASLEAEYAVFGTLSEVANGHTGQRISLQRFVLGVLLDDVLIQASQRLHLMSKGRYRLLRREHRSKGNRASGLELEVEDAYSGKTRPVATLSGGESFMAALSLALGLSDVVQAYAGGIRLDALFIDEGFGSLDQESLDLAVNALIELQSSGRMIGIISHVSELREQMALRLDVIATSRGSRVQMVGVPQ